MWKTPLEMIQKYITCEGHYDMVLRCHLRFLMHLSGDQKLNLPYYLLKSLQKMIARIQNHQEHRVRSLFHQGLIKLLIVFHLKKKGQTWEKFLFVSGFDAEKQKEEVKENKCETSGKKAEQDLEPANETRKESAEKLIVVNDELS